MAGSTRPPGRPRGAQQDPAARRAILLAAAERAIAEHGAGVSMEQIAATAEVSKATLYDNFDGKQGLTDALLDRYGQRVLESFAFGLATLTTARQVVRGGIEIFVRAIESQPEVYRFIVRNGDGGAVVADVAVPVTALIRSELERQGRDPAGADALAYATLGAVFASTERWGINQDPPREAFVDLLVDYVWAGLRAAGLEDTDEPVDLGSVAAAIDLALGTDPGSRPS
jgi:AcrR family transcriptional regulator